MSMAICGIGSVVVGDRAPAHPLTHPESLRRRWPQHVAVTTISGTRNIKGAGGGFGPDTFCRTIYKVVYLR